MTLEESPEFQKALNEACEKQYRGWLFGGDYAKAHSKDTIAATMEEMQRRRNEIEAKSKEIRRHAEQRRQEITLRANPHVREIDEAYRRKYGSGGLVCPNCRERDHGNKMNRIPWCLRCNLPLMTDEKAKDWKSPPKKTKSRDPTFNDPGEGVVHFPKKRGEKKRRR